MALKPCPECKAQISTTAENCPQCGFSFKKQPRNQAQLIVAVVLVGTFIWVGSSTDESKDKNSGQVTATGRPPLDFTKPLWAIKGRPVCNSEDELDAYNQRAPSRCTLVPTDMMVVEMEQGGFPWQTNKVRFVGTGKDIIEGWMFSFDLRN
jgi:hypothetical protein